MYTALICDAATLLHCQRGTNPMWNAVSYDVSIWIPYDLNILWSEYPMMRHATQAAWFQQPSLFTRKRTEDSIKCPNVKVSTRIYKLGYSTWCGMPSILYCNLLTHLSCLHAMPPCSGLNWEEDGGLHWRWLMVSPWIGVVIRAG